MIRKYKSKQSLRNDIGILWKKKNYKNGEEYFIGRIDILGDIREIIVFKNTNKTKMTHPDFVIRHQLKINEKNT